MKKSVYAQRNPVFRTEMNAIAYGIYRRNLCEGEGEASVFISEESEIMGVPEHELRIAFLSLAHLNLMAVWMEVSEQDSLRIAEHGVETADPDGQYRAMALETFRRYEAAADAAPQPLAAERQGMIVLSGVIR